MKSFFKNPRETAAKRSKAAVKAAFIAAILTVIWLPSYAEASAFQDPTSRQGGASGDLVPVEATVQGGDVSMGSSAQVVVLFRNDSGRPVELGAIQLYSSSTVSSNVSLNQCNQEPLPAGAACAIAVEVKGLQSGPWRVEMIMRHSGRARLTRATLTGTVSAGDGGQSRFISDIEAIPNEMDFGSLQNAQPVIRGIVLRNTTSQLIDINAIYIEAAENAGYRIKTDCSQLEPGQACMVILTWSPILPGQASGVLVIEHSGPTRMASVTLDGEFDPETSDEAETFPEAIPGKGLLVSSQSEVEFGTIATTSAITVSLVNIGDAPLTLENIRLANSDSGLSVSKNGCREGAILEPVQACPLTLTWSPVREGAILDDVQIAHTGARGILVLPVRGTSSGVISQDSKAIRLGTTPSPVSLAPGERAPSEIVINRDDNVDPASVLDGFVVTSHASKRAIISGPGGSRIVFDGEEVVIGGFLWYVNIRNSGVEFRSGEEKVLLLFDRSLSSVNRSSSQSGSSSASGGSGGSSATTN